jgi:ERCC4-type nuclease
LILIDDRLGSSKYGGERIRELLARPPLSTCAELTRLDSGDIAFSGNGPNGSTLVGIELKSILDLIASLDSHRLQGAQLPAMIEFGYGVRWLLIYGNYRCNPENGNLQIRKYVNRGIAGGKTQWIDYTLGKRSVPFGFVEGFLCSPSFTSLGILSHRVIDVDEAIAWVVVLYRTWQKPWSAHKSMRVLYDNTASESKNKDANALSEIAGTLLPTDRNSHLMYKAGVASKLARGIGYERAMAAGKHFRSVRAMVNASSEEWALVPGIGKVMARAVVDKVTEEREE